MNKHTPGPFYSWHRTDSHPLAANRPDPSDRTRGNPRVEPGDDYDMRC